MKLTTAPFARIVFVLFSHIAVFLWFATSASADAFPKQLLNKTISLTWGESMALVLVSSGQSMSNVFVYEKTIYISAAGRAFTRHRVKAVGTFQVAANSGERLNGPEGGGVTQFQGGTLISHQDQSGVVRRSVVTFDPNFSSCTLSQSTGKSASGIYTGIDGAQYKMTSNTVNSPSCSIKEGNALGG